MYEIVRRMAPCCDVDLFSSDLGPLAERGPSSAQALAAAVESVVRRHVSQPVPRWAVGVAAESTRSAAAKAARIEGLRASQRELARVIDAGRYDVAFVHTCGWSRSAPILEYLRTTPSVYYMQETRRTSHEIRMPRRPLVGVLPRPLLDGARRPYEAWLAARDHRAVARATVVLCNSHFTADMITASYGIDPVVCYLGVDSSVFRAPSRRGGAGVAESERAARRGPSPAARIVSVGALDATKGHDLVIEAAAIAARRSDTPVALDIVYEREFPGYRLHLERAAERTGVAVAFHHGLSDAELSGLYSRSRATVCAGRLEPFGLTVLESLSCGTPVVAVDQGGYRETVMDGVNGYLVHRDAHSLGLGIARALSGEHHFRPDELRTGALTRWGWDRTADQVMQTLAEVAAAGPRPA